MPGNKRRKRISKAIGSYPLGTASDSDSGTRDHHDTNAINCSLNELYKQSLKRKIPINEEKEETEANKEIEKALKKKARAKDRFIFSPSTTFDDLGGVDPIIFDLKSYLEPSESDQMELKLYKRILISGVSGVGKSALTEGMINYCGLPAFECSYDELFSGNLSENKSSCRTFFKLVKSLQPCIVVMDGLDRMIGKQNEAKIDKEQEIMTLTLMKCLRELNQNNGDIIIIGMANSVDSLDLRFKNAAQFDKVINIDIPDARTRSLILSAICRKIKFSDELNFNELGMKTTGYVAHDLVVLVRKACLIAAAKLKASKKINMKVDMCVTLNDFHAALKLTKPSLKSDGFAEIPQVTWADIGALDHVRRKLRRSVLATIRYPSFREKFCKAKISRGILLYGPPGCGKTSIAKALANEAGLSFFSIAGPEIMDKYVGESERKIREIFEKADKAKPCVIFFDEIESLCRDRDDSNQSSAAQNVLSQLLTLMDGFVSRSSFILATTNRVEKIDLAMLRPGRFDKHIYVGIPDKIGRLEILKIIAKNYVLAPEVSLESLAYDIRLKNFTGVDLRELVHSAFEIASEEMLDEVGNLDENSDFKIESHHFEAALKEQTASISDDQLKSYMEKAKNIGLQI